MSNILIIKHGSLGDIAQISGVLQDIRNYHHDKEIYLLTTRPYVELLSKCPFIDKVLIDKRLPRWNFLYLLKLRALINKYNFLIVYDLQNSSRTSFYRKFLFNTKNWSSTETVIKAGYKKNEFNKNSVLERFKFQLESSDIKTQHTLNPDFSWAAININQLLNKYFNSKFILIFPFSSAKNKNKQWPHYNNLIKILKSKYKFEIAIAPGPNEIEEAKKIDAVLITNNNKVLNIMELTGLIKKSSFVISNDTGPAHIAAHLNKDGVALFGTHTTPKKVSIETNNFYAIQSDNLEKLSANSVYEKIKDRLNLIN